MSFAPWALTLVGGVMTGAAICALFVVRFRRMPVTVVAIVAGVVVCAAGIGMIWAEPGRTDTSLASLFIVVGSAAGGFGLAAEAIAPLTRMRTDPPRADAVETAQRVAVVLLADAETEEYRPADVTRDLDAFERADVPLPPAIARTFVYASERARFRFAGGSPSRSAVRAISDALGARLRESGTDAPIETAYCTGGPSLAEAAARMSAHEGGTVVVAALTVAWTQAFDAAMSDLHALDPSGSRLRIEATEPLWASHAIAVRDAERTVTAFGDAPATDGVVLVSRGNPWQFDRAFPTAMEQTTYLAQRVRAELIDAGIPAERVRQAWLEWEEPDVGEAVRHLAALGAAQVALLPIDLLVESLNTTVDLHMAAERAANESGVRVAVVAPLGDDDAVVGALCAAVLEAAGRPTSG